MSNTSVLYLFIWFLLPVIPAFLFFKLLPNQAIVTGPFKGLKINLGGAFAAYFLLFLTAIPFMSRLIKDKYHNYEVWIVKGSVVDEQTGRPIPDQKNPTINIYPPVKIVNGDFSFKVIAERTGQKTVTFPLLAISADGYLPTNMDRLDYTINEKIDKKNCKMDCDEKQATFERFTIKKDSTNIQTAAYVHDDQ